jgi:uncharacterized membrane protein YeiH
VASLFGAVLVLFLAWIGAPRPINVAVTAASVFLIRVVAMSRHWEAPTPPGLS